VILRAALYLLVIGIIIFLPTYIRIRKSAAYHQKPNEVAIRRPGERLLGDPEPIIVIGSEDLPFALLSQSAYQRKPDAKKLNVGECVGSDGLLSQMGWERWPDFGSTELQTGIREHHLRVEVWWNIEQRKTAVAFGGTVFTNIRDWESNFRWFLPYHNDEYTLIVKSFGSAFITEYLSKVKQAQWPSSDHVQLLSTGHSLGGGLAQEFAYSLPKHEAVPRVNKVYAFDPSPVTGFFSVDRRLRDCNAANLATDRIYERGRYSQSFVRLQTLSRRQAQNIQ